MIDYPPYITRNKPTFARFNSYPKTDRGGKIVDTGLPACKAIFFFILLSYFLNRPDKQKRLRKNDKYISFELTIIISDLYTHSDT